MNYSYFFLQRLPDILLMIRSYLLPIFAVLTIGVASLFGAKTHLQNPYTSEYVIAQDTIPIQDRQDDFLNSPSSNPFDLNDPASVEQNVEYDAETNTYIITETIGNGYFRAPTYMTFDEYMEYRRQQDQRRYFDILQGKDAGDEANGLRDPVAEIDVKNTLLDRLFGGTEVDIKPAGNIDLTFGIDGQNIENPALLLRQQRQVNFDFDMAIKMNVEGKIGEKLNMSVNYNTQATFDFDNQLKLDYDTDAFSEDEIIKNIEAGNVSLPLRSQLITGAQSLFGIKTELQFGRLRLTALASQQKSEQENISVQGGAQQKYFEIRADDYDENRHFFLSHYNRNTFEDALSNLPQIKSLFRLEKVEVFITNDIAEAQNIREVVAIADLGEGLRSAIVTDNTNFLPPVVPVNPDISGLPLPDNNSNPLFDLLKSNPQNELTDRVTQVLSTPPFNLQQGKDYERMSARVLEPSQYTFNPELGFISINANIQPDQVVGVSYLYTYNGKQYQVGEFSEKAPTQDNDATKTQVIYTKMLKATTQRVDLPTWDLMMKNIYSTGAYQADPNEFYLDIYYEDPESTPRPYLPDTRLADQRLLNVFNLDRLNQQGDPQPDGVFDWVPGITINPQTGRMMFPKLEPFGEDLAETIDDQGDAERYIYPQLYDRSKTDAREYAYLNRFLLKGQFKSSVSSEISLGSFNIPEGSETVTAGGRILRRGIDYEIDYGIGKLRILNDEIFASGANINVSFEDNSLFSFQQKTMLGLRADYAFSKNLSLGGTYLQLFERPYTPKVNAGDDPLNNRIYGLDVNWTKKAPWATKLVDKLPFYSTKEESNFTFQAEGAAIQPGHAKAINEGTKDGNPDRDGGVVYIDDFEGATSQQDLRQSPNRWSLASVPRYHPEFPEADLLNDLQYGMNRAKLAWYRIQDNGDDNSTNPYTQVVSIREIFPNFTNTAGGLTSSVNANRAYTFNLDYYPSERGPYNFDTPSGTSISKGIDSGINPNTIALREPETRWAGIMTALQNNDFQAANYEFVEFWLLSPYLDETDGQGAAPNADINPGEILLQFGNVSEDILRDSRKFYENGLPSPLDPEGTEVPIVETNWGRVPVQQQITASFNSDQRVRDVQDVGLDGLSDAEERVKYAEYVNAVQSTYNVNLSDPSNDNFRSYRSDEVSGLNVFERYRDQTNPEGNSQSPTNGVSTAGNQNPDSEDLNRDFTLNETESYFEYRIPIEHDGNGGIDINSNPYLTGDVQVDDQSGRKWYRFKVPLDQIGEGNDYFKAYNGIQDFRSIRFMRMIVKDFTQPTHLRFARLELVRSQWRRLQNFGVNGPQIEFGDTDPGASFDVNEVNIEENDSKLPFNYILPPGISREQSIQSVNLNALQNEKSLSLNVCNLGEGKAKAIYKNTTFDMRFYEGIKMFVHAEEKMESIDLDDGDLTIFIRFGSDFTNNYYEYEMPLVLSKTEDGITSSDAGYPRIVWPEENDVRIEFQQLKNLKIERNSAGVSLREIYPLQLNATPHSAKGDYYRIKGNPNLGDVKSVLIGIRNPNKAITGDVNDDGLSHCAEVWINELRLFGIDSKGGYAALARATLDLADLGSVAGSVQYSSQGFGALNQTLLERNREEIFNADWSVNAELGKFFPEKSGIKIPFYYVEGREIKTPQFDPYDRDIELENKLDKFSGTEKDSVRIQALDRTKTRSVNVTNVRKERTGDKKPMPWDISNFSVSAEANKKEHSNPIIEDQTTREYRGALDYNYSTRSNYITPFKKLSKSKWLKLITDFNFNPVPGTLGFSSIMNRQIAKTKFRFAGNDERFSTFYQKQWTWDRNYVLNWDFAKNIKFNFNAVNSSVIDEAPREVLVAGEQSDLYRGEIDSQVEKDLVWNNIKNLGRDKNYQHNANLSYTVPTKLIPILDWTSIKASYGATYNWSANALNLQDSLGNVISNTQTRQINADLDFTKLYKKSKFLKQVESKKKNKRKRPASRTDGKEGKENALTEKKSDKKETKSKRKDSMSKATKLAVRPLLLIRKLKASYTENLGTVIPGYMPNNPDFFGMSNNFTNPGWKFVGGWQPNLSTDAYYGTDDYLYNNYDIISRSIWQQQQVTQQLARQWNGKLTLEPFNDFKVDFELNSDYTKFHTENFKRDTVFAGTIDPVNNATQEEFHHLASKDAGSYTISFFSLRTLFGDIDKRPEELFQQFIANQQTIADRLGGTASDHIDPEEAANGFPKGYSGKNQDVYVPAFLAAYTGKDVNNYSLDVFKILPKVNWRLNYSGLSKVPAFKEIFRSVKLSHAYRSTMTVNNFTTDLRYDYQDPTLTNPTTANYFTRYQIPELVITEQFSPLIGLDMRLKNDMNLRVDYKRGRTLGLSSIGYQLTTTNTEEFVIGFGYKLKKVDIPFLTGSKKKKKKKKDADKSKDGVKKGGRQSGRGGSSGSAEPGDLDLNFDFSFRDDATSIRNFAIPNTPGQDTRGATTLRISPSAEYRISRALSLRLFFDYNSNKPRTSQGYPITNTQGGVMVRFTLE